MRPVKALSVCGTGSISSAMLSEKLRTFLERYGFEMVSKEISPDELSAELVRAEYDFIACTTVLEGDYKIPVLNAIGFLIGMNEDEFTEKLLEQLGKLNLGETDSIGE